MTELQLIMLSTKIPVRKALYRPWRQPSLQLQNRLSPMLVMRLLEAGRRLTERW